MLSYSSILIYFPRDTSDALKKAKKDSKSLFRSRLKSVLEDMEEMEAQRFRLMSTSMSDITNAMVGAADMSKVKVDFEKMVRRVSFLEVRLTEALQVRSHIYDCILYWRLH
jgi:hypothetical protein